MGFRFLYKSNSKPVRWDVQQYSNSNKRLINISQHQTEAVAQYGKFSVEADSKLGSSPHL